MQTLSSGRVVDGFGWRGVSQGEAEGAEIRKLGGVQLITGILINHDDG